MGNIQMEADQIRFKNASYGNVQTALTAALTGGGGLDDRVEALEETVGDAEGGLVKDVEDLETTVGDAEGGLVKDVNDLGTAVSGLLPNVYSTTETKIGTYKGQDFYRKVFDNVTLGDNAYISFDFTDGIPIFMYGTAHSSGVGYDNYYIIPWYNKSDNQSAFPIFSDITKKISIECIGNLTTMTADIVVEYVKPAANNNSR